MSDVRVPMGPILDAFGVPAVVRLAPEDAGIDTRLVWLQPEIAGLPRGQGLRRRDRKRLAMVPRADVPTLPRLAAVDAPEVEGGAVLSWTVDAIDSEDVDEWRVWLVPVEA